MTETVSVSNVIAIASLVSEIWLATERLTYRHTHTQTDTVSSVKFAKDTYDFAANETDRQRQRERERAGQREGG